jgi:hypothetical protein
MLGRVTNVRYWGQIGLNADIGIRAGFDPTRTSDRRPRAPSPANIQSKLGANSTSI